MSVYAVVGDDAPWQDLNGTSEEVTIDGHAGVVATPVLNSVTGDILLGSSGFEGDDPYLLCAMSDLATFGDLHGKLVLIGTDTFMVRNVREKPGINLTRLILQKR